MTVFVTGLEGIVVVIGLGGTCVGFCVTVIVLVITLPSLAVVVATVFPPPAESVQAEDCGSGFVAEDWDPPWEAAPDECGAVPTTVVVECVAG